MALVAWLFFGLLWTAVGVAGWLFLILWCYGPCPKEGQTTFNPLSAHVAPFLWIVLGWWWIASRIRKRP